MNKKIIVVLVIILALIPMFSGCLEEDHKKNHKPTVEIITPSYGESVSKIVQISGYASDPDDDETLKKIEIMTDNNNWVTVEGKTEWSYEWITYDLEDGEYTIQVRAWDGADYSDVEKITVKVFNPIAQPGGHKWAVFIMAANFPVENESKLGNGGLYLAEEMVAYFVDNFNYPTSNIVILFDDGWLRKKDGFGDKLSLLSETPHSYDISYAGATKENVKSTLENIVTQANEFDESEVFIWLAGHGCGNTESYLTGDKLFEKSAVYLWNEEILEDKELGTILSNLRSNKVCIVVDACFSGGFADRVIFDIPTFILLRSRVPRSGRVVISGASKFRVGYASVTEGPLFTLLWFNGIKTGEADGFKSGLFERGRPTRLKIFKDGKISVEEAFYYARYVLRTDELLEEFDKSEPQINDQYPRRGIFGNNKGLILGE
jgi:hypothetical protein